MSKNDTTPALSLGNHIYLYRLLRDVIGCGKQTFITQIEEALVAGDMAATDLGFETTRALLEELDDCVNLTVFKGGRVYATVIANEAWDAALAKNDEPKQKDAGKRRSYKKKKGDKTLKAVRPKHIRRPEPEPALEPEPKTEPEAHIADAAPEKAAETKSIESAVDEAAKLVNSDIFSAEDETADESIPDALETAGEPEPAAAPETPQPKISLTVVYDPEHANAGVTTLESTPVEDSEQKTIVEPVTETDTTETELTLKPQQNGEAENPVKPVDQNEPKASADPEPLPKPVSKPQPKSTPAPQPEQGPIHEFKEEPKAESAPMAAATPAPELPNIPDDYPVDFALEVFCPGPLLHELSTYLPYGADVLGIVGEYYWIARERGTIQANRNRATFPLRYTRDGKRHEVTIRIRRNTGGPGATWAIDKIEVSAE